MDTMQESKIATDTATVRVEHLLELLEGAATHADSGKSNLPILNAVNITATGGALTATATDRYRLISGEIKQEEEGEIAPSLVPLADIKRIVALLKGEKVGRGQYVYATLSRVADMLTVSVRGNAISMTLRDGQFPPTDHLLEGDSSPVAVETIAFNPSLFADYGKIAGKKGRVTVEFKGESKPIRIHLDGDAVKWQALLMPMRKA
jgi:DNA polymerase III sliding clamp (beta) subunit (PCNA family)